MSIKQNTKDIEKLYDHAKIANEEMGVIREDIAEIKAHVAWIREVYDSWEKRWDIVETRTWWILGTIILGFLANIAFQLWK